MSKPDKTRLRQLAKDYSNNILGRGEYRQARREFITDLINNTTLLPENDYLPPAVARTDQHGRDTDDATTQFISKEDLQLQEAAAFSHFVATSEAAPASQPDRLTFWFFIIAGAGLVVAMITIIPGLVKDWSTQQQPSPRAILEQQENREGHRLINDFLAKKSWRKQDLDDFVAEWQQLTVVQTKFALNSIEIKRLGNIIYQRLLEERSLAVSDDGIALQRQRQLIDFAASVGINDARLQATLVSN